MDTITKTTTIFMSIAADKQGLQYMCVSLVFSILPAIP